MKKYNRVDDLLGGIPFLTNFVKISKMAKHLEKEQKTKAVFAEIVVVMDNGSLVYTIWNTPKTNSKRNINKLIDVLKADGLELLPDVIDHLAKAAAFGFLRKAGE